MLIDCGKADKQNVGRCGLAGEKLEAILKEQKAKLKDVLVMTVNSDGRAYFQKRGEKYKILQIEVNGEW